MTNLKPGARLTSAVSDVQLIVIKSSLAQGDLSCAGVPMLGPHEAAPADAQADPGEGALVLVGKRYVDAEGRIELLCAKGGAGSLTLDGAALQTKEAKKLPSSD